MDYNNYYTGQSGHPPPNQQQPPPPPSGSQIMHASMPPQNVRQAMPPGPPSHHQQLQQMQQQQHSGHHPLQMPSQQQQQQQQQHQNYHQVQPPHPHGTPVSHSGSPHPQQSQQTQMQQQPQPHHNHQSNLTGPPPQQPGLPSQQHHMHPQSPHHHGGPPMHIQQQMVRPQIGPSVMNHPQPGLQHPIHTQQNFFSGGQMPQPSVHHYPHQNPHHPHHPPQPHHHQPHHHHHQPHMMHIMSPMAPNHPHMGRNSPYYPSILQTEFRIMELNRRLQCRPISRHPNSPLPNNPFDESLWWDKFTSEFFEDDATLTLQLQEDKLVEYTIGRTLIPRFFRTYFDGGVTDLSINLRNPRETFIHPHLITLECDQAFIITNNNFRHPSIAASQGIVVHTEGHLILDFVSNNLDTLSIKSWKFYTRNCREYIDRSITAMGLPNAFLVEPVTRQGLTKSTITYLKMCMIMEPMQDLMFQNRQTKMDPRSCLRKFLFERYKFRSGEDNRGVPTNKRRKRKSAAAPAITAANTKKSKANMNNSIGNNSGPNINNMMSPANPPNFSLATESVMVVGEPSMMGGDFGDDNERMITRLENTQYDPTASTPSNVEDTDIMNSTTGSSDNVISSNNNGDSSLENHTMSPSLLQQRQQLPPVQSITRALPDQTDQQSPQDVDLQRQRQHQQRLQMNINDQPQLEDSPNSCRVDQVAILDQSEEVLQQSVSQDSLIPSPPQATIPTIQSMQSQQQQSVQPPAVSTPQPSTPQLQQPPPPPLPLQQQQQSQPQSQTPLSQQEQPQLQPQPPRPPSQQSQPQQPQQNNELQPSQQVEELVQIQPNQQQSLDETSQKDAIRVDQLVSVKEEVKLQQQSVGMVIEAKVNIINEARNDSNLLVGDNSMERIENHNNSIPPLNEESNSSTQLPCSTASTTPTIEQQQPVDNGVA